MSRSLSTWDQLGLGLMTFAFFLGAGNMIFPPLAGQMAGENILPAIAGFLLTAVGLPFLGILAIAKVAGGLPTLAQHLPRPASIALGLSIYLVMVPLFGVPRTALVAFEMGFIPFIEGDTTWVLGVFSVVYFAIAMALALYQGQLLNTVGKFITPMLLTLLVVIAVGISLNPQGQIGAASGEYVESPFTKGVVEGYLTMDTLAALLFGILFISTLKAKGITEKRDQFRTLMIAGLIAAAGLTFVYSALFYLGATSHGITPNAANGGQIFTEYVGALFGPAGQLLLAGIVTLACLTTAVGGLSAFGGYMTVITDKPCYRVTVIVSALICMAITNIGLSNLINVSIPVLLAIYPVAMSLIVLNLIRDKLVQPKLTFALVLGVALLFGALDGAQFLKLTLPAWLPDLSVLPLFDKGMGWLVPTIIALIVSLLMARRLGDTEERLSTA